MVEKSITDACCWYGSDDCKMPETEFVTISTTEILHTFTNVSNALAAEILNSSPSTPYSSLFKISRHLMIVDSICFDTD